MIRRAALVLASLVGACAAEEPAALEVSQVTQEAGVCAGPTTTYGIDVSRFQGDIDWDAVAGSGVKFAFIQVSRSLTDVDMKFDFNWRRAKEVGILRGAYQRFHPGQDVMAQANLFLSKLGPYQAGDLPPVLDVEDADGLGPTAIANAVRQWVEYVEQELGVRPIIYTGFYFWRDSVGGADFSEYPLWIANYGASCPLVPPAWTKWTIHQYSSTANVPGITANTCDVNKFNGTLAELQALAQPPACGDSLCNGEEDADSCPADCHPCQVIDSSTEAGSIVDDTSQCFVAGGNPMYMRTENAGFGSSLRWTHATDAETASNYGRWDLSFAAAGRYRVEAYTPAPFGMSKQAVYEVHHAGGTSDATVDQSANDGWNLVGEFEFAAGGQGQFIRVDDNTGEPNSTNTKIVFDALRFTLLKEAKVDDDEPAYDDSPGCAAAGSAGGLALIGVVLVPFGRRRRRR
jgi:GH25 family lysozyme M1 (1,4-beta-N-acetylmuramidase)